MNRDIRALIVGKGLKCWQVAKEMGVHEATLSRWLRDVLSVEKRQEILAAIDRATKEERHNV